MEKSLRLLEEETLSLKKQGRGYEALFQLERMCVEMLNLLAVTSYEELNNASVAIKILKLSLGLDRGNWVALSNMAHLLGKNNDLEGAGFAISEAIEWANDTSADVFFNAGVIFSLLKDNHQAIEMYRKSLTIEDRPITHFNLGCELLLNQQFKEGWEQYESRLNAFPELKSMKEKWSKYPTWDGDRSKKVLIYSEQGIGDLLHLIRYIPSAGINCILEVQSEAVKICKKVISNVIARGDECGQIDAAIPIGSLPYILNVSLNDSIGSYIEIEGTPIEDGLIKIGCVWAGNAKHNNDSRRSCPLKHFKPISKLSYVKLFSLQKQVDQNRNWEGKNINLLADVDFTLIDLSEDVNDFLDTANKITTLDIVLTVDTAVAHLAGAMGKTVWLLLPYNHDWRWPKEGDKTPLYPSMKIFRQKNRDDWESVITEVVKSLEDLHQNPTVSLQEHKAD